MFSMQKSLMLVLVAVLGLTVSACSWQVNRNDDGTWTVTGTITQAELQGQLDAALADPLIHNVRAEFHDGYITASADRSNTAGTHTDALTLRIDLSVVNGHLGVVISNVQSNGDSIDPTLVSVWNQRLANRLETASKRSPDSTLQAVTITPAAVTMVWHRDQLRRSN